MMVLLLFNDPITVLLCCFDSVYNLLFVTWEEEEPAFDFMIYAWISILYCMMLQGFMYTIMYSI